MIPSQLRALWRTAPRRAGVLTLVALIHLLLLLALLRVADVPRVFGERSGPLTVELLPNASAPAERRTERASPPSGGAPKRATPQPDRPAPPPEVDLSEESVAGIWSKVTALDRTQMAAADVARIAPTVRPGPASQADDDGGGAPGDSDVVGRRPNGEPLYAAEWQRRPTNAELGTYLPANRPDEGWGLVACRTVADFRVEDCVELDQSPLGSGYARAVRQAAWQFRVRPPRKGGRPLIGAWVSIRIDYTQRRAAAQ